MRFSEHVVLITGGAGGIGKATAERFASEGANVILADRRGDDAAAAAAAIATAYGTRAIAYEYDQRDQEQVSALVATVIREFSRIDVVFANAGFSRVSPFLEISKKEWDMTFDVNVAGTFFLCQAAAREMVKRKIQGRMILTASVCADFVGNQLTHYCCSKAAVKMLARCMATELGNYRIRVNAVSPGVVGTDMVEPLLSDDRVARMVRRTTPSGRWASPREIASVVAFLASHESSFVNGQAITVCGGQTNPIVPAWKPLNYELENVQDWQGPVDRYPFAE